jgi:MoxR-like ATPase
VDKAYNEEEQQQQTIESVEKSYEHQHTITEEVCLATIGTVKSFLNEQIIGQQDLVDGLLLALLADGHILVEGPPGLAKTRSIKMLASCVESHFHRIQFTPDLLPADLTGTEIYRPQNGTFVFQPGPLFNEIVLADEINRAAAKVQSALLEAMEERQVTIGRKSYHLPPLFLVMATQNPLEQEGTYPLPEAQLDRFMLHLELDYPSAADELSILRLNHAENKVERSIVPPKLTQLQIFAARQYALQTIASAPIENYIVNLVTATRHPQAYSSDLARWLAYGVSPRASIALLRCARVKAWLAGRTFVTPDDVQYCIYPVLRHRLMLTVEAEADGITPKDIMSLLLQKVIVA